MNNPQNNEPLEQKMSASKLSRSQLWIGLAILSAFIAVSGILVMNSGVRNIIKRETGAKLPQGLAQPTGEAAVSEAPLAVSQVFPADKSRDIEANSIITIIFNKPVVPLTALEDRSSLSSPVVISPTVEGEGEWLNTSVFVFHPTKGLKNGQRYEAVINAGLKDVSGISSLEDDYRWSFETREAKVGGIRLVKGNVIPKEGYTNVLLDEVFALDFLQTMDSLSTELAISLASDDEIKVPLEFGWNEEKNSVVITPTQRLKIDTSYTLQVSEDASTLEGSPLSQGFSWSFRTLPMPKIISVSPEDQAVQTNYSPELVLQFTSPMRIDSIKEKVKISPSPDGEIEWWYNEWDYSFHAYILKPSTKYNVDILPGMEDIYGNLVEKGMSFQFETAPLHPEAYLRMPYNAALFRTIAEQQYTYLSMVNVKGAEVTLYKLNMDEALKYIAGEVNFNYTLPDEQNLVWKKYFINEAGENNRNNLKISLLGDGDQPLDTGVYFLGIKASEITSDELQYFTDARIFIVANANLTLKTSHTEALVWLTDLETGKPIAGSPITLKGSQSIDLGRGVTDENGVALIKYPDTYFSSTVYAYTSEGETFSMAASFWGSGSDDYSYALWQAYYAIPEQWRAYAYTERPIYRPGQPVYFKAVIREDDDLSYSMPVHNTARVVIQSFDKVVWEENLTISEYGTIAGKFNLSDDAALGDYYLSVYLPGFESSIGGVSFNVAEYRRPEFTVDVTLDQKEITPGTPLTAEINAEYYSGGKVANGTVHWSLTSTPYSFSPDEPYDEYSFSDEDMDTYYEGFPQGEGMELVAQGDTKLDTQGYGRVELSPELGKSQKSRQMVFESDITDTGGNVVSGRENFIVHQSEYYAGIKPLKYLGREGEEQTFSVVLLDWKQIPVSNYPVKVEIVERRWHSVQEQQPDGSILWKTEVENIPVVSFDSVLTNNEGMAEVKFTPPNGGIYRGRVCVLDLAEREHCASTLLWVSGREYVPWRQSNDRSFSMVTDKKSYLPGETAEIMIASPFEGLAYGLITIERGHIRQHEVIPIDSNSLIYKLPITDEMAPNIYVSCVIVKGVDENNPKPSFRVGLAELMVSPQNSELKIDMKAEPATASPGEEVSFTLHVTDQQGNPVQAEVSLGLSDLSTLSLLSPNSEPIHSFFYNRRALGVQTSVALNNNIDDYNALMEESLVAGAKMGSGGGKGGGALGVVEVRQEFPDTAYWNAFLETNADGMATAVVRLPDNLTTWRLEARAVTESTLVGQATLDLVSSKPLLVSPKTPRFFVAGDIAEIGSVVMNNTDGDLEVNVSLQVEGLQVLDDVQQRVTVPSRQQRYVRWKVVAENDVDQANLIFSAQSGEYQDASKPTLGALPDQGIPVFQFVTTETVGTSGSIKEKGKRQESIILPTIPPGVEGNITLEVEPSLAAGMLDGLTYLEHYPYECIEQTVSRFLPNVVTMKALRMSEQLDPELEKKLQSLVQVGLQRIYAHQNPDGGWGWWSATRSDVQTSAYVVMGLNEAKEAGYPVSQDVLDRGINFLNSSLVSPKSIRYPYEYNQMAFVLYVLSRAGKPEAAYGGQLYEYRDKLAVHGLAFLAHALYVANQDDQRVNTLLSDLQNRAITSATGTHWQEKERDPYSWNTDTRTTAIVLSVLREIQPQNPLNENAVRWLMSSRIEGHWRGTQETAWSLMALAGWLEISGDLSGQYQYAVVLNNRRLGEWKVEGGNIKDKNELRIATNELLKTELNNLVLTKNDPSGTLYYSIHLSYPIPVEEVEPLSQGVSVTREYFMKDDPLSSISEAHLGDTVYGRITIIVPNDVHFLVVEDPLPAGLEVIDQSLLTSSQDETPQQLNWEDMLYRGWGWWYFNHVEFRDEKVVLASEYLPAGTYVYTYIARATSIGKYQTIPTTAFEFYFPEVFGRGAGMVFTVLP